MAARAMWDATVDRSGAGGGGGAGVGAAAGDGDDDEVPPPPLAPAPAPYSPTEADADADAARGAGIGEGDGAGGGAAGTAEATEAAEIAAAVDAWRALPLEERLTKVLRRLRDVYQYCVYCGTEFSSDIDLETNCPGISEDVH